MKRTMLVALLIFTVISAGCIFFESKDAAPTPTPSHTSTVSRPSTSGSSTSIQYPTARIVDVRFGQPQYKAGDVVYAEIDVQNTGQVNITKEEVILEATVVKLDNWLANTYLRTMSPEEKSMSFTMTYTIPLEQGEAGLLGANFNTVAERSGVSLSGDYEIKLTLKVNGRTVDTETVSLHLW